MNYYMRKPQVHVLGLVEGQLPPTSLWKTRATKTGIQRRRLGLMPPNGYRSVCDPIEEPELLAVAASVPLIAA
jgi:hypothetical protein